MATVEEQNAIEEEIAGQMSPDVDGEPEEEPSGDVEEPEDAAPEPPFVGITPEEVEKRFKSVGRSWDTYSRAVEMQLDFTRDLFKDCPMCFASQVHGYVDMRDAGKFPDPLKNLILEFLGISTERDYKQDDQITTCPRCDGEGLLATGSHVHSASVILCPTCEGYGCSPPPKQDKLTAPVPAPSIAPITETVQPLNTEDVDGFGEPRILPDGRPNPNHGKMPQFKVQVPPWGVTAGLTAQHAA
jgi:hypothetical protein